MHTTARVASDIRSHSGTRWTRFSIQLELVKLAQGKDSRGSCQARRQRGVEAWTCIPRSRRQFYAGWWALVGTHQGDNNQYANATALAAKHELHRSLQPSCIKSSCSPLDAQYRLTVEMTATTDSNGHSEGLYGIDNAPSSLPALSVCARGFLSEKYDFIIIGGGTAGLAVAARLTEDPDIVVGVLEVGKSRLDDPLVDNPAAFVHMLGNPEYDHCFKTVPQVGPLAIVTKPIVDMDSSKAIEVSSII